MGVPSRLMRCCACHTDAVTRVLACPRAPVGPGQLSHTLPWLQGTLPCKLAHSQICSSELCPEQPGPLSPISELPTLASLIQTTNASKYLTHSPEILQDPADSMLDTLSSCDSHTSTLSPHPVLAPQESCCIHVYSHKLGMSPGIPAHSFCSHSPRGSHTHGLLNTTPLILLLSRNPAHGSAPQGVLPTCPGPSYIGSHTLSSHLLCKCRPLHDHTCRLLCKVSCFTHIEPPQGVWPTWQHPPQMPIQIPT